MEDGKTSVCCMCGDIGFSVELFRCNNCLHRYQHSYCSNNYMKSSKPTEICDWCQSELKSSPSSSTSSKASARNVGSIIITSKPSEYSGESSPSKSHGSNEHMRKNLIISGVPSPRTAARRYKLLKDVKC
ncbi:Late cornified envelope protein 1E [Heracleum sosnowskyi]|uniref:Late cornified envelope protein 1E n=1 Tax=Heracleum sosnowskyi TaxID=360622 RepID=A0AAD8HDX6_9APIA|nr:Late cornified envelope protein 1E [Heracleum sosnowskyi]